MINTPIHKIPADGNSLAFTVAAELDSRNSISLHEQLESVIAHDNEEKHLSVMLDWAMQIRSELGISWSESIDAAMILYYG